MLALLVSEFRGREEETGFEDVHGGRHGNRVEILEFDLSDLEIIRREF